MNRASIRPLALALAGALASLVPLGALAGEKHHNGEGAKAAVHAAKINNAGEHKNIAQQQAAIQQKLALKQQQNHVAINGTGTNRTGLNRTGINGTGVRSNGLVGEVAHHRTGVGTTGQHHNMETGPMVSSLHSVVGKLHQAEHDYDGHRVQAIHQLEQAVHTLNGGANGHHVNGVGTSAGTGTGVNHAHTGARSGTGTGTGKAGAPRMSQAESDGHLRQAHQELTQLESRMTTGNGTGTMAAHHQQAHSHIQQALQHINAALATK